MPTRRDHHPHADAYRPTQAGRAIVRNTLLSVLLAIALLALCLGTSSRAAVTASTTVNGGGVPSTVPTTEQILGDVRALVELGPRRTGTPGGDRAAEFVKGSLRDSGVPHVWENNATTYQWEATHERVSVGGQQIDAFASEHSFFGESNGEWTGNFSTGPGGRTAQVVDVGNGTALDLLGKDLRGKIVLFDLRFQLPLIGMGVATEFLHDPGLSLLTQPSLLAQGNPYITNYTSVLREAKKRGAVGFVGVLADYFDSNKYRNEYYRRLQVTFPGFWVTKTEGRRMRTLLRQHDRRATLELEGRRYETKARTVLGFLPGQSEETLMIQSHHDSNGPGAVEDATGTSSVLALARHYAQLPLAQRKRSLLFATFDTHFTGYQSHQDFVRRYLEGKPPADGEPKMTIVANATVEHIAKAGTVRGGKLVVDNRLEPRAFFRTGGRQVRSALIHAIRKHDLRRMALLPLRNISPSGAMPTDASFVSEAGVPTVAYIAGPIYLYDEADTLDKVAVDQLRPVTGAFVDIIDRFDELSAQTLKRG